MRWFYTANKFLCPSPALGKIPFERTTSVELPEQTAWDNGNQIILRNFALKMMAYLIQKVPYQEGEICAA